MSETAEQRSRIMRAVKSRDTKPELKVRRMLHGLGYRYRLHRKDLPGKPDIVFPSRRCLIFVHGCFWHGHDCKRGDRRPARNAEYWSKKIDRNVERFCEQQALLVDQGWRVLTLWECELKDEQTLIDRLRRFLAE